MFYAQLDDSGVCRAVTQSAGPLIGPRFVPLPFLDVALLGKRWTGSAWVDA